MAQNSQAAKRTLYFLFGAVLLFMAGGNKAFSKENQVADHGEACRLRVLFLTRVLLDGAVNYAVTGGGEKLRYPDDLAEVDDPSLLEGLTYWVNDDRTICLVSCGHQGRDDTAKAPYPYFFDNKLGLSSEPVTSEMLNDKPSLTLSQFLGIPKLQERYQVLNIGKFKVLAVKREDDDSDVVVEVLNPDEGLKSLQSKFGQTNAYRLSKDELNDIISKNQVQDSTVLETLREHCTK